MYNNRIGIVIGNNYPNSDKKLKYALADAEKIKEILENKDTCGFNVKYFPDKTSREVSLAIEKTLRYADNDLIFIYYSGHGKKDHEGKLCLLFNDTEEDSLVSTSLTFDFINKCLKYPSRKSVVIVLDCCYSGAAGTRDGDVDVTEDFKNLYGSGTIILTSTSSIGSSKAREDDKLGHGIFTYYLIEGMENGNAANCDGIVTIDGLYNYASKKTIERTSQMNCLQSPKMIGEKEGIIPIGKNSLKVRNNEYELKKKQLFDKYFKYDLPVPILNLSQTILRNYYEDQSLLEVVDKKQYDLLNSFLDNKISHENYIDVIQVLNGICMSTAVAPVLAVPKLKELITSKFSYINIEEWTTQIQEVPIGNTSADGGSRGKRVMLGGEKALPFYFDAPMPNRNQVAIDVFDMRIGLPPAIKENYDEVMDSPGEWAKKNVEKFNADMITIHLISTDPLIKDTSTKDAAKTVEEVLQAVDVPIAIGGSGNPQKDPEVLAKAAEVAEGERCLLASASLNLDYTKIAEAATKYDHDVLSWTQLDMSAQKELNRKLMKQCNVPRDRIIMDPTTAALGYGLDYAYTNMECIRLAALMGDDELTFPMSSGTTNAWGARESWMVSSPRKEDSDWGPRVYRGPNWEIITGLSLAIAGNDLFMMMHPTSVAVLKHITQTLFGSIEAEPVDIANWIRSKL